MTLQVRDLSVIYGGNTALDGFNLTVASGELVGLIGPNGAGKSTAVNAMTGIIKPNSGSVQIDQKELVGASPARMLRSGMARTFQQAQLWRGMSVIQNLTVPVLRLGRRAAEQRAREVAELFGITRLLDVSAALLPYGARRLVEVSRAMMTEPRIVMLDEPGAGLTPNEKDSLRQALHTLSESNVSVVLIDHDMDLVMNTCKRVTVLDAGRVLAEGTPIEIRENPEVITAYLGVSK
ncbi:MAG: ABC transporter ATP-binding protein [Microbacteriaceae bacterium]|nr:ABC transporter ATP-binding protein [Cryobacterium sp.]MBX3103984.1 ABC transporter ATP-binding protein [Cryobacterium sp.]MCC6376323.1 ABC transporter ATP-binding protein [Microbacteriaceae bacterium]